MTRIAVFGLGSIGQRHVKNLLEMGETDLLGCDVRTGDEGFAPDLPIPITSAASMVWDWKPDVVLVCVPPVGHYALANRAIKAGAHVFIEKPMATTELECEHLRFQAKEEGVQLAVGYQLLACPSVQVFPRDWKQLHIWDKQDMGAWPNGTYSRDLLLDFSHEISQVLFWAGSVPSSVSIDRKNPVQCMIHLAWSDGRTAQIDLASDFDGYERGAISDCGSWMFDREENDEAYRTELKMFLAGTPICTGEHGMSVMQILGMVHE